MNRANVALNRIRPAIWTSLLWGAAIAAAPIVNFLLGGLSYKDLIVLAVACGGIWTLASKKGLVAGLTAWVATFSLGYRTIHITAGYALHPSEAMIWGLFLLALNELPDVRRRTARTPAWFFAFALFWVWGWVAAIPESGPYGPMGWDRMFSEFRNFLMLFPVWFVAVVATERKTVGNGR